MSTRGTLTRDEAVKIAGEAAVALVESKGCEFTNRHQTDGDERVEFAASVWFDPGNLRANLADPSGHSAWQAGAEDLAGQRVLTAYYYQSPEALKLAGEDLSNIEWVIQGFEVF